MGIEEQIDRLIDLGEDIRSRLDLLVELASDHFVGAGKMVVEEPAKEASLDGLPDLRTFAQPNLRWRILEPGEVVCSSDWICARNNLPSDPPNGLGWRPVDASVGTSVCQDDPCIFARLVADEPAKGPEHRAGPMPDPGEGYRILSKNPPEDLRDDDEFFHSTLGRWRESIHAAWGYKRQDPYCWYRRKIEVAKEPEPAWEPKVGDWVKVTRPENWKEWKDPLWREEMHIYDGRVFEFVKWSQWSAGRRASLKGIDWFFHSDWLSPAEPPEPEYREPILPADVGKECEFSDDSMSWEEGVLIGWRANFNTFNWKSERDSHRYARIKKDA